MTKIVDFTKLARRATKALRTACAHAYARKRSGLERCTRCGDEFPCRVACVHIDCIVQRMVMGRAEFPLDYPLSLMITDDTGTRIILDTTPDDPVDWTIPTSLEDVL